MADASPERGEVYARIVYWGIEGAGKSANLRSIHARLRSDHRGPLRQVPTRLDPTVSYELLPIELGEVAGVRTRLEIVAVPGAPEQAPTRKQLLDRADGIVLVLDASRERIDENLAAFDELRSALAAYGRSLESVPLVIQHNKEDLADPFALEELHRKLDVRGAAVFTAVAHEGRGVLQTLTTISKRVIRTLREAPSPSVQGERTPDPMPEPPREPRPRRLEPEPAPLAPPARAPRSLEETAPAPTLDDEETLPPVELEDTGPAGALEEAALASETDENLAAREAERAAGRTELFFQDSFESAKAAAARPAPSALDADWSIRSVGAARLAGPRSVRVPVLLADGSGRELRLHLTLSLEHAEDPGD